MLKFGDWFALANVNPRDPGPGHTDPGITCAFSAGEGFDMVPTLGRIGALFSPVVWVELQPGHELEDALRVELPHLRDDRHSAGSSPWLLRCPPRQPRKS